MLFMLYINITGNLTFDTTEDDLKKFFEDTSNHNVFEYKFLIFFLIQSLLLFV